MLYLVSTPIGNLDDISLRQAQTLASCEVILAEDTRSAGILLQRVREAFSLTTRPDLRIVSYYKDREFEKLHEAMELVRSGREVALISEAGTPLVSDPGYLLTKQVIKEELPYTVIPGPSAVINALLHSGLNPGTFMFLGFLPKKPGDVRKTLTKCVQMRQIMKDTVFVAFESPHRISSTLEAIEAILPDATVSVSREMTKKFEETVRGPASELKSVAFRGELTIVIG
jgi:16S rRNA (cytidine1402-2'-O)-methyltransferase